MESDRSGDFYAAIDIASKISKADHRSDVRRWLHVSAATRALREGNTDDARRCAYEVDAVDQRAHLLASVGRSVGHRDRSEALAILNEAYRLTSSGPVTAATVRGLISVGKAMAALDTERSFDLAAEAVRASNQVRILPADRQRITRSLKANAARSEGVYELLEEVGISQLLAMLASKDYDRALDLAQSLDVVSLKLEAVLSVVTANL